MRSMQDKITAEVARIAEANGLEATETTGATGNIGKWWIQDGFDARLVVEFGFHPGYATFTASGPAADHAAEHASGQQWSAEPFDGGEGQAYNLTVDYSRPGHFARFFGLLADLLAPWRPAASIRQEIGAIRAALLEEGQHSPAERLGQAMSALAPPAGEHPHRAAAAGWLDDALAFLPPERGRKIACLADLLSSAPAALTA